MKRSLLSLLSVVAVMCVMMLTSCVSSKKIIYFQGADSLYVEPQAITQSIEMRLKPADNIYVKVSCANPELLEVFKNDVTIGTGSSHSNIGGNSGGSLGSLYGYTVTNEGDVLLPLIGTVHVGGMTTEEAARTIEQAIISAGLINDPDVTVRLINARVTVVGGVGGPRVVNLTSERNTIVDILAQCGDIADDGLKRNVKLFREIEGRRMMYTIDMTRVDVFNSPAYYVQQNDLIYVQPNRAKTVKNSSFYTFLGAGASMLGIVSSLISLYLVAKTL